MDPEAPKILKHDEWPGYRRYFYIATVLCIIYLVVVFLAGGDAGGAHH
jgi:hypothetical protein